uniref:EAL domain-containing protein n=1 Tax=Deinococcus sp. TaxID=47478 RepID=UPI002869A309
ALAPLLTTLPGVRAARLYRAGLDGQLHSWAAVDAAVPAPAGVHLITVQEALALPGSDGVDIQVELHLDVPTADVLTVRDMLAGVMPHLRARLSTLEREAAAAAADSRELALLNRALWALDVATQRDMLFQEVIDAVHDLLEVEHVGIGLVDGEVLTLREFAGQGEWIQHFPLAQGVAGQVIRSGQAALIEDVSTKPEYYAMHPGVVSEICVPLLDGGRVVAVLDVESVGRRLGPRDLRPLLTLGSWLGRSLERRRVHAETERQRLALNLLHDLRTSFDRATDEGAAIRAVVEGLSRTFGYSHVSAYLVQGGEAVLQHQIGYSQIIDRIPLSRGVMGRCCRTGQVQWLQDAAHDPDVLRAEDTVTSELCVPLTLSGQVIGAVNVETLRDQAPLQTWDREIIESVAGYLQQALERHHLQGRAREQEATYRLLAEHTTDLVCLHAPDGSLTYISPSVRTVLGYAPRHLLGHTPRIVLTPGDRRELAQSTDGALRTRRWQAHHREGHVVWLDTTITRIAGDESGVYLSCSRDVTQQHRAQEELEWAATHDSLTRLTNRAHLYATLEREMARARQSGQPDYAVLYLDMNRFKVVNDSLGHSAGDELLQAFAGRLSASMRPGDLVCRLGGDEFAVLMTGLSLPCLETVQAAARRLLLALDEPFTLRGHTVRVTVSIGIAPGERHHATPADILRDADLSMYRAKRDPHHGVATFSADMHDRAVRQLTLEADLPHAAARGELQVMYQPIVALEGGETTALEALVRWRHPTLGLVSPLDFIPLAEELEVISGIGAFVLEEACRTFAGVPGTCRVQVNVSPRQFRGRAFVQTVQGVLARTGLAPTRLGLEITESALVEDIEEAARTLGELRALGICVQIDDFGTGHSSLAFLHRFPVDALKVDRAFIAKLGEDEVSADLVRTVLLLGQALRVQVIAEGVETPAQRDHLLALGCRSGQGYLFSRPLERAAALAWVGAPPG